MPRKPSPQGTPRLRLSASFLESLEKRFASEGDRLVESLFKDNPKVAAELIGRLVMTSDPPPTEKLDSLEDIGRHILKRAGVDEPDSAAIKGAIEAHETFLARIEAIAQASGACPQTMN